MSAADYAALPTTDDERQDTQSYPPTQPAPKDQSGFRTDRFWPDLSTLTNRALLVAVIALCGVLFLKVQSTYFKKESAAVSESEKPVVEMSSGFGGRPRTGKLNVG